MSGVVNLENGAGELWLTVPRPAGIADNSIQVQVLADGIWKPETSAAVVESTSSRLRYRLEPGAGTVSRIYRVSFSVP